VEEKVVVNLSTVGVVRKGICSISLQLRRMKRIMKRWSTIQKKTMVRKKKRK
jgi:hypothetical protein